MDIITALRQSTAPKPIDLTGFSRTKKIAICIFAVGIVVAAVGGLIWWRSRQPEPLPVEPVESDPEDLIVPNSASILQAVKNSDAQTLVELMQSESVNLDLKDQGRSLLCLALVYYQAAAKNAILSENMAAGCEGPKVILDLLLADPRVDVNSPFPDGSSPLHFACEHCETILPQLLERKELLLNPQDKKGKTPLHYAAANGPVSVVEKLCQKGANVNAKDNQDRSPLTWAFKRRNRVCVLELLQHQPEITIEDKREAADKGWSDVKKVLLSCDANKKLLEFAFLTYERVLQKDTRAQAGKVFDAIAEAVTSDGCAPTANTRTIEIIEDYQSESSASANPIVLEKPQQPVEKSDTSYVIRACKAFCNYPETDAKDLAIEDFWDLRIKGNSEKDCPDVAEIIRGGDIEKIKALTKDQVNTKDDRGCYPIQYARKKETIEALMQAGAKLNIETDRESGDTLLHDAVCEDNAEKIQILQGFVNPSKKNIAGETPLALAVKQGRLKASEALLAKLNCDLNTPDDAGAYLIQFASKKEMIQLLIDRGAKLNIEDMSPSGDTLLHKAVMDNSAEKIQALSSFIDFNKKNSRGDTPLILAAKRKKKKALQALLNIGSPTIDFNLQDGRGRTLLHCIVLKGLDEFILEATLNKACWETLDNKGNSPVSLGIKKQCSGVPSILKTYLDLPFNPQYLFDAARLGRNDLIDVLTDISSKRRLDINRQDPRTGQTALHFAVLAGQLATVKHLVSVKKADTSLKDMQQRTPLLAVKDLPPKCPNRREIVQSLIRSSTEAHLQSMTASKPAK